MTRGRGIVEGGRTGTRALAWAFAVLLVGCFDSHGVASEVAPDGTPFALVVRHGGPGFGSSGFLRLETDDAFVVAPPGELSVCSGVAAPWLRQRAAGVLAATGAWDLPPRPQGECSCHGCGEVRVTLRSAGGVSRSFSYDCGGFHPARTLYAFGDLVPTFRETATSCEPGVTVPWGEVSVEVVVVSAFRPPFDAWYGRAVRLDAAGQLVVSQLDEDDATRRTACTGTVDERVRLDVVADVEDLVEGTVSAPRFSEGAPCPGDPLIGLRVLYDDPRAPPRDVLLTNDCDRPGRGRFAERVLELAADRCGL